MSEREIELKWQRLAEKSDKSDATMTKYIHFVEDAERAKKIDWKK